jgi:hypothetical protein
MLFASSGNGVPGQCLATVVRYARAKDHNKPQLMSRVFTDAASTQINVLDGDVSFPARTTGLSALRDLLVRQFSEQYEDVSTRCCMDSATYSPGVLHCTWLVCLRERSSGTLRIGAGRYQWQFQDVTAKTGCDDWLVDHLQIDIDHMQPVDTCRVSGLLDALETLSYPWVSLPVMRLLAGRHTELQSCADLMEQ